MAKDTTKLIADQAKEIANLKAQLKSRDQKDTSISEKQLSLDQDLAASMARRLEIKEKIAESEDIERRAAEQKRKAEAKGDHDLFVKFKKMERHKKVQLEILKAEEKSVEASIDQTKQLQKHTKLLKQRQELGEKYSDTFSESLGFLDDIESSIKKIPIAGEFLSKAIGIDGLKDKLVENFENGWAASAEGAEGATGATKMFGMSMGAVLGIAIALGAVFEMLKVGFELDQEISDLAKGMGMTKHEAEESHHQMLEIAKTTSVIGANAESLNQANLDLNAILGTNVQASTEMLEAQVLLTKQYGLTGAEAAEFQAVSAGTGKTVEQNLLMVESMVEGYNTMTGDSMNFKEISKDIAKTSKATLASYKGDVKALTMAAIQAKKMGMSLEDTQQVADKLLDIESSVEAEMKANVLTGKHMNMNAARQLALEGKTAEAAAEAVSQAGSLSELNDMNIIQRKSIAEAAGVTVDQLMKSAELQEYSNALNGAEITDMKDLTDAQINQLMSQKSITKEKAAQLLKDKQIASNQEKMAAMADKMSAVFAGIASIMLPIVDAIGTIATGIGNGIVKSLEFVKQLWTDIAPYVEGIATTVAIMLVPSLYTAAASMVTMAVTALPAILASVGAWAVEQGAVAIAAAASAIAAIASASALTLGIGAVAIAGGIAVAAAAMTSEKDKAKKVDDAQIDPDGGLIVQGKEGKYQLNKNDSIVAGTNLGGTINDSASMETGDTGILGGLVSAITAPFDAVGSLLSGGNDNAEVVALLKELIAKVEQPVMVNIGGRVVDEMEKQTSLRRTYNTKMDSGYGTFG
jgi:hypothetical protein